MLSLVISICELRLKFFVKKSIFLFVTGWCQFGETSLRRRSAFYIYRPAGTEVTISATPADGYYFDKWSNGWTANHITFTLNSDIDLTAVFKPLSD